MHKQIYTAIRDFMEETLNLMLLQDVPDTDLRIEIEETQTGTEWTGVKIQKTPSEAVLKSYISGAKDVAWNFAFESKQSINPTVAGYINYACYLEGLAEALAGRFKLGHFPALPKGVRLERFIPITLSSLNFAAEGYSCYIADMRFVFNIY